jgi:hypothetical protein
VTAWCARSPGPQGTGPGPSPVHDVGERPGKPPRGRSAASHPKPNDVAPKGAIAYQLATGPTAAARRCLPGRRRRSSPSAGRPGRPRHRSPRPPAACHRLAAPGCRERRPPATSPFPAARLCLRPPPARRNRLLPPLTAPRPAPRASPAALPAFTSAGGLKRTSPPRREMLKDHDEATKPHGSSAQPPAGFRCLYGCRADTATMDGRRHDHASRTATAARAGSGGLGHARLSSETGDGGRGGSGAVGGVAAHRGTQAVRAR